MIFGSPVFLVCCCLFVVHQVLQKGFHVSLPFIDSYLDSFCVMPILLTLLLAEKQTVFKKGSDYRLSKLETGMAVLYVALVAEVLFPFLTTRFTADWMDVLLYALGSYIFFHTTNRRPGVLSKNRDMGSGIRNQELEVRN